MRIVSWNVESIRAHHDQVIDWVDVHAPDVICLQETKADARRFPRSEFERRNYELAIHGGQDGRGGVAIACRTPVTDITLGIPGALAPFDDPRCVAITVDGVRVHNAYAPNGRRVGTDAHRFKLAWFTLYRSWLTAERSHFDQVIVAADLNIAPDDLDVWEPGRYRKRNLTSPDERAAFAALVNGADLVDVVRKHFGDQRVFTWWNRRGDFYETDRGWRLDHLLTSPAVAERVTGVAIDRAERGRPGSTDHAPLTLDLN